MKAQHKIFISKYKQYQKNEFHNSKLINLIINIKTHHINVYHSKEFREQLLFILKGRKSWTGDVKHWFWSIYKGIARKPIRQADFTGQRLVLNKASSEIKDDLPF